jgi:ABC-type nitrate/sulfonate/bicarbonate transport system substrate-binding protein
MTPPTPSRRQFVKASLTASLLLGGGGLLAACGDDDDTAAPTGDTDTSGGDTTSTTAAELRKLAVMMPFPVSLNFIADMAAKSGGAMASHGIDLDLTFARSAPQALQQLAGDSVALVRNGPIAVARAVANEGAPFVSIGMPVQQLLYLLISTSDAPIDSLDELVGKKIGLPTLGGQAEDLINLLMKSAGLDPTTISLEAVGNETTSYALVEEGRVDAIFGTREAAAVMENAGLTPHLAEVDDANPLMGVSLVTTHETMESRRADLVAYLQAMGEVMRTIHEGDGDDLLALVADDYDLTDLKQPDEVDRTVIQTIADMWFAEGEENLLRNVPEQWEKGVAAFQRLKIIPAEAKATDFYTNDLWDQAFG